MAFFVNYFNTKNIVAEVMQLPSCGMKQCVALRNGMDALLLLCGAMRWLK
jgi:hypothetical protein